MTERFHDELENTFGVQKGQGAIRFTDLNPDWKPGSVIVATRDDYYIQIEPIHKFLVETKETVLTMHVNRHSKLVSRPSFASVNNVLLFASTRTADSPSEMEDV
jgi:hypothetical protein